MILYSLKNFSYRYRVDEEPALKQLDLDIYAGEFLLLVGPSGSGKTTLARALCRLVPDFYGGTISGEIRYRDRLLQDWDARSLARETGIVFQVPETQLFFPNLERDIAFGLENLGMENQVMKRRVAETMDFLGLAPLRDKTTWELSGGEKQKVALAGILAMRPRVIIADEPTSQLDPIAAEEIITLLRRLNQESGTTIILVEQRLDRCFHLADRVVVLDSGRVAFSGPPSRQVEWAVERGYPLLPTIPAIFANRVHGSLPLTVKEGRECLASSTASLDVQAPPAVAIPARVIGPRLASLERVSFGYRPKQPVLNNVSLALHAGEIIMLLGANGAGKSTLLKILAGTLRPARGTLWLDTKRANGRPAAGLVPQSVEDFFLGDTLEEDARLVLDSSGMARLQTQLERFGLEDAWKRDPRDLSCGEKQQAALALTLASEARLLLLDEPTLGLDVVSKDNLGRMLQEAATGAARTVLLATHDMEFASEYATRVIFLHQGELIADQAVEEALDDQFFYSSQAARLFAGFDDRVKNRRQARERLATLLGRESLRVLP